METMDISKESVHEWKDQKQKKTMDKETKSKFEVSTHGPLKQQKIPKKSKYNILLQGIVSSVS